MTSLLALAVLALQPQTATQLARDGEAAYRAKDYIQSAELYDRAYRLDPKLTTALYNEACSLALGGKRPEALAALEELAGKGFNQAEMLRTDTDLVSLRDDPRWAKIVEKVEATARRNPPPARFRPPYVSLPVPTDPVPFEARLGSESEAVWLEGDVMTFLTRGKGERMDLSGGIQQPMRRIGTSDLWIAQYRMPDWSKAIVTYAFLGDRLVPGQSFKPKLWRGPDAPTYEKAATLQGQVIERTVHSKALDEDRKIHVYLPPNAPKRNLPAFFLADGQGCDEFARALEPLILARKVRPCAIVGVDSADYRGDRSKGYDSKLDYRGLEYVPGEDDDRFARHLRFFVDEVGAYVAKEFGVSRRRRDLAVTGFSNGGAFSAAVAYRRPEAFGTSMPLSLGIPTQDAKPRKPFPRMLFAAGTLEQFSSSTESMFKRMKAEGADATYETYVAGHDPEMWHLAFSRMAPRVFPGR